ncbi:MAG TPA: choice-of-anchor D domain-containing protein [Candidatus Sulfotelmatobacter sp.]|nr:choice-of-anchor D domain-containing protein [Candidatus Sulfotelmatobacter sp.]
MKRNGIVVRSLFSCLLLLSPALAQQSKSNTNPVPKPATSDYGKLPLLFVQNQGQTDSQVKYFSNGPGYDVFLTSGQMVLRLSPSQPTPGATKPTTGPQPTMGNAHISTSSHVSVPTPTANTTVAFKLVGARNNPEVVGEKLQVTKANYFVGNDRKKWHTNVPTYGQVRYKNVYPGIDLVYYGNQRQIEYDFDLSPGADASKIQFDIQGADNVTVDGDGNLVLKKGSGELRFQAPAVYQESQGQRSKVAGSYALSGANRVGFVIANHDSSKALVIDPVLVYSTFLGGRAFDYPQGIAVDSIGNAYVVGQTNSPDFPLATLGNLTPSQTYVFLSKLDVSGTTLLWADYVCGTSGNDWPAGVAVDSQGSAYITGVANSTDFPTVNPFQATQNGNSDAFLSKVSADGSTLVYSTYIGGSNWDQPSGIAVDSTGLATIAGTTTSQDFPLQNAFQASISPSQYSYWGNYGFVSKFSADGTSLVFSTYLAGSQINLNYCNCAPSSNINGIAVDSVGNVYVAGSTDTTDFPVSQGAYGTTYPTTTVNGNESSFVTSFTPSGGLNYSTYFGGATYTYVSAIAVDTTGAVYVTGQAPADGSFPITSNSICDPSVSNCNYGFVAKLNASGSGVIYSTFLGPNNGTVGRRIKVDANGDAFVLAYFGNQSFTLTNPIEMYNNTGGPLIDEIDPTGSTELFSTFLGGDNGADPIDLALDANSSIYVVGGTQSADFPILQSAFQGLLDGQYDVFISKIAQDNASAFTIYPSLLQFSTRNVGTTSTAQTAVIRNMGTAALNISTKTLTGDFAETDDCASMVPAAGTCTFTVTFTPTAPGSRFGTILIGDDAAGSPHFINLVGDGSSPIVSLTPTSLTFTSAPLNSTSTAQTVTISNTGNATLNISGIQTTGDFGQTNNCPPSLGFGSSCQFQVTFTPTAGGSRTGTLTLTDNAPDSPQTVTLSGSGFVTTGTVSPASLSFSNQNVNSTSAAQVVTITNTGGNVMTVSGVSTSGDFSQTNNCSSLAANGGTCSISVTFTPTASGNRTGALVISDNAQGNPHSVALSGMGISGTASLSASSLSFTALNVGTTSSAQTLTITNNGNGPLSVLSVQVNGDFAQTNNCTTVAPTASCTVQVTFTPTSSGARTGNLTISSSAIGGPQSVSLTGSGVDFSMPASGGSDTIKAGAAATYQFNIQSVGGNFSGAVNLACQGIPAFATCAVNPTAVTPGANGSSVSVTVTTKATVSASASSGIKGSGVMLSFWVSGGFGLFGVVMLGNKRNSNRRFLAMMTLAFMLTATLFGCGGASTAGQQAAVQGTPSGNYTLIVVGTSGTAQHFSSLTLVVQ